MFSTLRAVFGRSGLATASKVANYALIALTAFAAAALVVKATSLEWSADLPDPDRRSTDASAARSPARAPDDGIILRRNLFGAAAVESDETVATGDGAALELRGVAASEGRSFAVFENLDSGEQNVFAVGDRVFGGPKLVAVDPRGADVLVKGKRKRYEIEEREQGAAPAAARPAAASKKAGKEAAGVRRTGAGAYLVDRREVEHTIANLNEVITQARAVPVLADGQSVGFKLFRIHRGSIFEKIGLQDGDIVQRVNDTNLTDPTRAVGLLEEVQSMSQIRVNFLRGGKPMTHTYTIR